MKIFLLALVFAGLTASAQAQNTDPKPASYPACRLGTRLAVDPGRQPSGNDAIYMVPKGTVVNVDMRLTPISQRIAQVRCELAEDQPAFCGSGGCWFKICGNDFVGWGPPPHEPKDGVDGKDGASGQPGKPGDTGPQGEPGVQGAPGLNGLNGEQGARGLTGRQGPTGRDGRDAKKSRCGTGCKVAILAAIGGGIAAGVILPRGGKSNPAPGPRGPGAGIGGNF